MNLAARLPGAFLGALVAVLATAASAQFTTELVASGLDRPLFVTAPPGDTERLFIVEWEGRIRILENGVLLPEPFLDITDIVFFDAFERGLLGLVFDPEYESNGFFYVYFINHATPNGSSVIRRFEVSEDPNVADRDSMFRIFTLGQVGGDHNGGHIEFGPEGYLWLGLGDGGVAPNQRSQDLSSLFGKMIRIDPTTDDFPADLQNNYGIPPTNPFVGQPGIREEIWSYGLRNPYRFSFDQNGDLYLGDVGQGEFEEIDFQPGTSPGGENYGWPILEASQCYPPGTGSCDTAGLTPPLHEYSHLAVGFCVTGGRVYRGSAIPALEGHYFFGDYITDVVWTLRVENGQAFDVKDRTLEATPGGGLELANIVAFGTDGTGEMYVVDLGGAQSNGEIYKIVPDPNVVSVPEPVSSGPSMSAPSPNPFRRETRVTIRLARPTHLEVGVYDAAGRLVRRLVEGSVASGVFPVSWDGRNEAGALAPAGIYFLRSEGSEVRASRRVTLLR